MVRNVLPVTLQIFVSEDSTKVEFIGPKRRRADGMYSGFSDIGAQEGYVFQMQLTVVNANIEPMLQLADIAAYVCSHASDESAENSFFREQRGRFRYWSQAVFAANPTVERDAAKSARHPSP